VLLEGSDGYRLTELEDREVYDAIENVYVLDRSQRRLFTVANLLPRALAGRLQKWVEGGRYARFFDNLEDTITVERFQVFDFEAMRTFPVVLEPLLFYVLHRVTTRIQDPADAATFKLCVLDEAWRFIQHPTLRDDFLSKANPNWPRATLVDLMNTHFATTTGEVVARVNKNWDDDVRTARRAARRSKRRIDGQRRLPSRNVRATMNSGNDRSWVTTDIVTSAVNDLS
jgi:hypothetical protein